MFDRIILNFVVAYLSKQNRIVKNTIDVLGDKPQYKEVVEQHKKVKESFDEVIDTLSRDFI